jgi:hypothetical protein
VSILTKKEWAALFFVGARQSKEKSRALPRQAYFDPSRSILFESERAERATKRKKK